MQKIASEGMLLHRSSDVSCKFPTKEITGA